MDLPPFPGFRPQAFTFLRDLRANNDRDWFKPRKDAYEDEVVWPMQCLVADLAARFAREGIPLTVDPSRAVFRIYRDVRFSKNKDPYKTHCGAVLTRSGSKDDNGLLYLHVEPGASFAAAGFWQPEKGFLGRYRNALVHAPSAFLEVVESLREHGLSLSEEDALKRQPRGFEDHADAAVADFLRLKSLIVEERYPDEALEQPDFPDRVARFTRASHGLLTFGWNLMDGATPS